MNCPRGLIPIAIGVTDLTLMIFTYSYNSGGPINPARDFSPRRVPFHNYDLFIDQTLTNKTSEFRLLSAMVGYGTETFSAGNFYFWVPLIACPVGSVLGSLIYKFLIEHHWPSELDTTDPSSNEPVAKFNYKIHRIPSFQINKY